MKVFELMRSEVTSVRMDDCVRNAVALLADNRLSALPVVDRLGKVAGVFSTADLATAAAEVGDEVAREFLFERTAVREEFRRDP
jgi:CBS domain-containing protein